MQNNQSYLAEIRDTVKNNYRHFFALDDMPTQPTQLPQMPEFQIQLFISRALKNHFPINIQFNDHSPEMSGNLSKLTNERFLLTDSNQHITRILNILEIKAIKRA
ncbi:hypothetical protein HMPREF9103_02549 [Lentilactobacillus parafarraginis F0439]|jgi:predicted transcriptional regulator|uniref:Uncharacterized protein n=2 Tax=Lentilactobacillus parafarraginis TaxID=390842 RepID=A0A0R1YRG5_9LACO|nr:hypothetical protein [Lentilactobacillus parafarraginis]EHL96069.1 hypothetical protein HMPREF9103_02549 [Lentilactobacillus parafarraginis F0439]KRM44813.1 hypothetical protein FD47_GL002920 [Lentilactobacillus parafarraginis DSM 18390 = JCM 14109]